MKKINILIYISGIISIVAVGFWMFVFASKPLSNQTTNWSDFGSYIGGVIGPILSFVSIILVLHTIKQTQDNHKEQIKLIRNEHVYTKFIDLSSYLDETIKKSWISNNTITSTMIRDIYTSVVCHRLFNDDNLSIAAKEAIQLESIYNVMQDNHHNSIDEVVTIIRSLNKFIFNSMSDDKELMSNMIESKIPKHQRFILFYFMSYTHASDAIELKTKWPTFWDPSQNSDVIAAH
ncbi:hypothetical protein [Citrobacter youngae]|uniref:hypothetical protein n=1 Tax=Citrobacter youngae TaxID=133448 RepID=UPI00397E4810